MKTIIGTTIAGLVLTLSGCVSDPYNYYGYYGVYTPTYYTGYYGAVYYPGEIATFPTYYRGYPGDVIYTESDATTDVVTFEAF
jgi:hypothetical protein